MVKIARNSVLVLIDVQKGFDDPAWGTRNNTLAESVMESLLREFRCHKLRVIHVRHDSMNPNSLLKSGKKTFEFKDIIHPLPNELIVTKHVNSAFIGTDLEKVLRDMGTPDVYYAGLVTDHCVSTTARMSGNLGFNSFVIEDACATFDTRDRKGNVIPAEVVHNVNLASIDGEFAKVISFTEMEF